MSAWAESVDLKKAFPAWGMVLLVPEIVEPNLLSLVDTLLS
jgi:hypothetical protein